MTRSSASPAATTAAGRPSVGHGLGRIQVGSAVTLGSIAATRMIVLAAAAGAPGSEDAVDVALHAEARALGEPEAAAVFEVEGFDPAVPSRRFSVTHVRSLTSPDQARAPEVMIMRGELRAVMSAARLGPDRRLLMQKNASFAERRGYRPLAVASASMQADGTWGPMQVHGFVPVRTARARGFRSDVTSRPEVWVRVPVWPATLRWLHWLNVLAIVLLTMTGFYIADPFFLPGVGSVGSGYFMGYVRLVHYTVAWGWITLGVIRLYLLFFSRNRFVRWPALWPLKGKQDVRNLGRTVSAYLLIHPDQSPTYIAHNPLQQLTYTAIYVMSVIQALTGLALYGLYNARSGFWKVFEWPVAWMGAPDVRLTHYLIMLLFWVFLVLHIYLAVRADTIERHGGLSAMISGGVWIRTGSHPVDGPNL
jgi:Ni/Fe-hydrogenase b-type cytochrome subunit